MNRQNTPEQEESIETQESIILMAPDDDNGDSSGIDLDDYLDADFDDEDDDQDDDGDGDFSFEDYLDDDFDEDDAKSDDDGDDEDDDDDDSDDEDDDDSDDEDDDDDDSDEDDDDEESDENVIVISSEDSHLSDSTFEELGLNSALLKGVRSRGYKRPTPVQAASFELAADGQDLVVRSKTGTGKTAAFLLPSLQQLKDRERKTRVLVLTPTRELALQVAEEAEYLSDYMKINVVALYGGVSLRPQTEALERGAEVVVGTPGRILDHIRRGNLNLSKINTAILDEADEMLSMGFYEDVTTILDHVRRDSQLLLFSATIDASISGIINRYMTDPKEIMLSTDVRSVEGITHKLYPCSDAYPKARSLLYTLYIEQPESALIFCNTRADTQFIANYLTRQGFDSEAISSDNSQKEREQTMGRIKRGELNFLVATDLASRGIDISHLSHVINYDLPQDPNTYLHRTGRTGRAGNVGTAISLYSGRDLTIQMNLEKNLEIPFEHKELPSPEEAARIFMDQRLVELRKAKDSTAYESYIALAKSMVEELPEDERNNLIATALKVFFASLRIKEKGHVEETDAPQSEEREERRSARGRGSKRGGRSGERRDRKGSRSRSGDRRRSDRDGDRRGGRGRRSDGRGRGRDGDDKRRGRRDDSRSDRKDNRGRSSDNKRGSSRKKSSGDSGSGDINISDWLDDSGSGGASSRSESSDSRNNDRRRRRGRRGRGGNRRGGNGSSRRSNQDDS